MGQPCHICGDVGYAHLLASCSNCLKSHEHIYCMPVLLFAVPEMWHCEACQLQDILSQKLEMKFVDDSMSSSFERVNEKTKERMAQIDTLRSSMFTGTVQSSDKKEKTQGTDDGLSKMPAHKAVASPKDKPAAQSLSRYNKSSKRVETGKVKFLPAEDAIMLKADGKPTASTIGSGSRPISFGASQFPPSRSPTVFPITSPRSAHQKGPTHGSPGHSKPLPAVSTHKSVLQSQAFPSQKSPRVSESLRKKRKIEEDRPGIILDLLTSGSSFHKNSSKANMRLTDTLLYCSPEVCVGISGVTIKEKSNESSLLKFDKPTGKEVSTIPSRFLGKEGPVEGFSCTPIGISNSTFLSHFGKESLNPPAINATWKGSFEIVGKDFPGKLYDGFWAHPPRKLSRKAYEVSKRMPKILQFKLHPRDLWPDIFHIDGPSGNDIALYFFPGDFARSNEKYSCLLELIGKQDVMMQSCLDSVELLVFSSKQLTAGSQSLNTPEYLWGVFRSLKRSSLSLKWNKHESHAPLGKARNDHHHPTNVTHGCECDMVEDMEIDMIGGKDIGVVDEPLKRWHTSDSNEFQLKLHADREKFSTSNTSSRWRKLNESHERGDKDNAWMTGRVNHAVGSSQNMPFKIHTKEHIESAAQEHLRDTKREQRVERANVSERLTVVKKDHLGSPRVVGSSQNVPFKIHAQKQIESAAQEHLRDTKREQRVERANVSEHLTVVKKDRLGSPRAVGSSQNVPSKIHAQKQIESTAQVHLRDAKREQRIERANVSEHLTVVKKDRLDSSHALGSSQNVPFKIHAQKQIESAAQEHLRDAKREQRIGRANVSEHLTVVKDRLDSPHGVGSSQNVPFKIHAKKQIEGSSQEHLRDAKREQRIGRANVSEHLTVVKDRLDSPHGVGSSQNVPFKIHAKKQIEGSSQEHLRDSKREQRMKRTTASQHLTVVKKEHLDSPRAVESSQNVPLKMHAQKQIKSTAQEHLRDVKMEQRMERATVSHHLTVVKEDHFDSLSGFSGKVTSVAAPMDDREKLILKRPSSPCFPKFPPGFSKPIALKERSYSGGLPFKNENPNTVDVNSRRSSGSRSQRDVKDRKY